MKMFYKILLLSFLVSFFALPVLAQERVNSFIVDIRVNKDASIEVVERIEYNFDNLERHGIYRYIPIKYKARGGNYNFRISDIKVVDENGKFYNYDVSYPGNDVNIKIGDANKYVTGVKNYNVYYKIQRAINYFDDHDELYWNVTGDEWDVPIDYVQTRVHLPTEVNQNNVQEECFIGTSGSKENCQIVDGIFIANNLNISEGLTIVTGWPKGVVYQPEWYEEFIEVIKDNWILGLPIIVFIFMFYFWYTRGRDPKGRGTIIAQFDAPDNLSPLEVGTIIDERVSNKDVSAEIIYLAISGYLKIKQTEEKQIIGKKTDYIFEKLKESDGSLNNPQERLFENIFTGTDTSVKLSSLKNNFFMTLQDVKSLSYGRLVRKNYFKSNPNAVKGACIAIAVAFSMLGILFTSWIFGGLGVISFVISGVIIFIFGMIMSVKTKKGVLAKEHILGLKKYLEVAEKDRINFHNAPNKNPEHFEKLLPYAMVLGVEKQWAKQFEGIYNQEPGWYHAGTGNYFSALVLTDSLSSFKSQASSTMMSSASSGRSGFGGGGFSGGGGGGGGGGSW